MPFELIAFILLENLHQILTERSQKSKERICQIDECQYSLLHHQLKYCTLHTCFKVDCQNKRLLSYGDKHPYCSFHSCDKYMCHLPAYKISSTNKQCIKHKCHETTCYKTNETNLIYCSEH